MRIHSGNGFLITILFLAIAAGAAIYYELHQALLLRSLQFLANRFTDEVFSGSIRIRDARLTRELKLELEGITAEMHSRKGSVPIEIGSVRSQSSLLHLFDKASVLFTFDDAGLAHSRRAGAQGTFHVRLGNHWRFQLDSDIQEIGMEELEWIDPQSLHGASGTLSGKATAEAGQGIDPHFQLELRTDVSGGYVQARLLDSFLSYVPQTDKRDRIKLLVAQGGLVQFQRGILTIQLTDPRKLKILLSMMVLEYNLDLNLNVEVRVDSDRAFFQVAQLMGLITVQAHE